MLIILTAQSYIYSKVSPFSAMELDSKEMCIGFSLKTLPVASGVSILNKINVYNVNVNSNH